MASLYSDTDPQVEELQVRLLRHTPAWRKLEMLAGLFTTARMLARSGISQRHPQADQNEIDRRLAALLYGEDISRNLFGE
jgi:hypothetical protein